MKTLQIAFATLALGISAAQAQLSQPPPPGGSWNPYLIQGFVTPAPMLPAEFNGTGQIIFDVGNTGSSPIVWVTNQEMQLTISLSYGMPDVADPDDSSDAITAIGGPGAAWFSWQYFPLDATFVGTQIADIPPDSRETITIDYRVTQNSFENESFKNGFNVNIAPPAYTNPQPTDDDTVSAYTYVEAFDYGDAPASYGEVGHTINLQKNLITDRYLAYMYLGNVVDPEPAYQASSDATGDDVNQTGGLNVNDEDGVVFPSMIPGTTVNIPVTVTLWDFDPENPSAQATLRGWIDWDKSGTFTNVAERIVNLDVAAFLEEEAAWTGPRSFVIQVPVTVPIDATGSYFARFRFGATVTATALTASHGEVEDYRFSIPSLTGGTITGIVVADTTGDGVGDTPVNGVTINLLDENGVPVLDVFNQPITTVTNPDGTYTFTDVPSGTYQIEKIPTGTYTSLSDSDGGNPDLIGDQVLVVVVVGEESPGNNFLEFLQACPPDWADWQDRWDTPLGGDTSPTGNPDGDRYSNLLEFAFCMPPHSGNVKPFCVFESDSVPGGVDGVFRRTAMGPNDVVFSLEYTDTLGNPTVWQSVVLDGSNTTVSNNGNGSESVRISDLETLTGLNAGEGFVRIRVTLDDGTTQATDTTEVLGWALTEFGLCCMTYNNPFLACSTFTGTVDAIAGQDLIVTDSVGPFDLADSIDAGVSYYIEVISGDNEGQRFDVVSASGDRITLANDASLSAKLPPFNTLTGAPPSSLAGDLIVLRRHFTIAQLFPPDSLGATGSHTTSDQVQVYADGGYTYYWLYDDNGTARWVDVADNTLADQGDTIIQPGQGMFFLNRTQAIDLLAFGEVRDNDFIRPLSPAMNLVGGGYPVDQSPVGTAGRQMTLLNGFVGTQDFKTADSIFLWRTDENSTATGFDTYWLLNGAPQQPGLVQWTQHGDVNADDRGSEELLLFNRAAFIRSAPGIATYTTPVPWTP